MGTARWRFLHGLILVFYAFSVWHALILGVDVSYYAWIRPVVWLAQIPLLALFIRRLVLPIRNSSRRSPSQLATIRVTRYALIACSAIAIASVLLIVATGHSGLISTV